MPTPKLQKSPVGGGRVFIKIPADAAFDIKKMNKITQSVLGKLGCLGCHSGFDLRYIFEHHFEVDPQLNVRGSIGPII